MYLYRQVCGIVYWVARSVCGSKGVFIGRLPDSSQPRESSLWLRFRLLVFLNASACSMRTIVRLVKSTMLVKESLQLLQAAVGQLQKTG